jgi:cytochrome c-type biogenesis protein CcmH/NrfG
MSLLIKALEQAAKDRKASRAAADAAKSDSPQPPAATESGSIEPTLEPLPPPRAPARAPSAAPASTPTGTPAAPSLSAAPPRANSLALDSSAPAPRGPSSLSDLAQAEAQQQRARAAAVMQAGGRSGHAIAWLRANPVMAFAGIATIAGLLFAIYVYIQVAHPGMFVRQAATKPQEAAPGAPPAPPVAPPAAVSGLPETAAPGPVASAPDLVLAPPGTQPVGPAASSGSIGPAPSTVGPASAPASGPLPSSSVLAAGPPSEAPRAAATERPLEPRGSLRADQRPDAPAPAARAERAERAAVAAASPPGAGREAISVSPTASQPRINPSVSQAYTLLQAGSLEEARALYGKVVQAEPLNIDALLGLAYIASQENRSEDAIKHYLRILQLNPRHAVAQGALIGLMGRADPGASESRLKQLIAREPSAFLHFILGNLYADQSQWSQAQQSYFQAHHLEPENPDYAYNLAVGLDHLRQSKLALNFYRRADQLASAQGRSNFSVSHARERIRALASQVE